LLVLTNHEYVFCMSSATVTTSSVMSSRMSRGLPVSCRELDLAVVEAELVRARLALRRVALSSPSTSIRLLNLRSEAETPSARAAAATLQGCDPFQNVGQAHGLCRTDGPAFCEACARVQAHHGARLCIEAQGAFNLTATRTAQGCAGARKHQRALEQ
jgi:hypothetical protein